MVQLKLRVHYYPTSDRQQVQQRIAQDLGVLRPQDGAADADWYRPPLLVQDLGRLVNDLVAGVERLLDGFAAEARHQALFDKKLSQEEAWIRQGIKARRTRNEGRVRALQKMREERDAIEQVRKRLLDTGATEDELKAAKQNITGGFPLRIASNSKIIEYLAVIGFYDLPLDYLATFSDKVEAVTSEQVRDAFQRRVHPDRMTTVLLGRLDQ